MPDWVMSLVTVLAGVLSATALFFFVFTRGALLVRALKPGTPAPDAHVYPIYSHLGLMRLVDWQPVISAILLFQYDRLVSIITQGMRGMDLRDRRVLITSCAFGNVMPRVAEAAREAGARDVAVVDIVENELTHAERKLRGQATTIDYQRGNAVAMPLPDGSVDANIIFFLLHELPDDLKPQVLREACRVLAPGGKLFLAEFHRPHPFGLRLLSWTYFKVFEPLGLSLWTTHDPAAQLASMPGLQVERSVVFHGNFQVVVATKPRP